MEYWWKENKKLAITVGAILVGILLFRMFVLGPIDDGAKKARLDLDAAKTQYARMTAHGVPSDDALSRASADVNGLQKSLDESAGDLGLKVTGDFSTRPGEDQARQWENLKMDTPIKLRDEAVGHGCKFPDSLGFGAIGATPLPASCPELIERLAVVDRACRAAVSAGVESITGIDMVRGMDENPVGTPETGRFLNKRPVLIKVKGSSDSIFRMVHGLQARGQFLCVESFSATRDAGQDFLSADIVVTGLLVDPQGSVEPRKDRE